MPVRQLRRLDPAPRDIWEWASRKAGIRAFHIGRDRFDPLRRDNPAWVIEEKGALVVGAIHPLLPEMEVHFAFEGRLECEGRFGPMFERLLAATPDRQAIGRGFVIDLTDRPNRAYVEPVLKNSAFEIDGEWLEFSLADPGAVAPPDFPARCRAVPAAAGDAADLARVQSEAGVRNPWDASVWEQALTSGYAAWLLHSDDGGVAGYALAAPVMDREGAIADVAVAPSHQRRGACESLARLAIRELCGADARQVTVRVDVESGGGLALARKLGFRQTLAGTRYRRPADEEEVRRRQESQRGHAVKFGGWR